jgi:putative oxidoreductase
MRPSDAWRLVYRLTVGCFWLYYGSQKWRGVGWMRPLMQHAAAVNPIPGLQQLLAAVVAPNWQVFAVLQGAGETLVGALIVLGLLTRPAAALATLLALNVSFTVAFELSDFGLRWLYYLAILASAELFFGPAGPLALDRLLAKRYRRPAPT